MPNYLYYDYATSQVAKVKEETIEYEKATTMQSHFNQKCLLNGSTLIGRKQSFAYLMNQKKYIPVVISIHPIEIYFPTSSLKDPHCLWINYTAIKRIEYKKKTCTFIFNDDTRLECNHPSRIKENMHAIYRYLLRFDHSQ